MDQWITSSVSYADFLQILVIEVPDRDRADPLMEPLERCPDMAA